MSPKRTSPNKKRPTDGGEEVRSEAGLHLHWEGRRLYRSRVPVPRVLEPDKRLTLGSEGKNLVIRVAATTNREPSVTPRSLDSREKSKAVKANHRPPDENAAVAEQVCSCLDGLRPPAGRWHSAATERGVLEPHRMGGEKPQC
jgi:hypothetical protein